MTKRSALLAIFILAALAQLHAPSRCGAQEGFATLSGQVYDLTLAPVRAAEVSIDGVGKAFTDLKGYFELERIPFGTHRVTVRAPGFRTDATDVSLARRHEEFTTTLQELPAKGGAGGELSNRPAEEPLPVPCLYGLSGRIMLPDTRVLPRRTQAVGYSVARAGHPLPLIRQRVSHLSLTVGLPERIEVSATAQEVSQSILGAFPYRKTTAFGVKRSCDPFRLGESEIEWAFGGRDFSGRDGEVFVAFDLPVFDGQKLTVVPTWHSDTGNHVVHVAYENVLSARGGRTATLLAEALQSDFDLPGFESGFDYYNAGIRYGFARDRSAHVYWHHDAVNKFRMIGIGAAMAFE